MIKTKRIEQISVQDWDALVMETYGREYNFQQQDDCKFRGTFKFVVPIVSPEDYENDSVPEVVNHADMGVSFAAWLARDPKQPLDGNGVDVEETSDQWSIDLWWDRNFYPHVDMVIDDLHKRGLLPVGQYSIKIDW